MTQIGLEINLDGLVITRDQKLGCTSPGINLQEIQKIEIKITVIAIRSVQ